MKTIKKTGGTQVAPKLTLRPLRATLRVGYLRCAPVLASVAFFRILLFVCFACFAGNLHAQTTLSGDHVVDGDLNVGTTGTPGNLTVTGDALFSGTRMGIGVTPAATLHIKTTLDEANGALLLQRGYGWSQDENYYLKMLTQTGTAEGILVNGYGQTMTKNLGVGSLTRTNYFSALSLPFSAYNAGNALLAEFQTDFSGDDRALIRFKSKNSTFMYMGVKSVPNGGTQYGFYNSGGSTATPLMVINDSTWNSNVGIATETPAAKLDVNGGAIVRGDLNVQSGGKISLFTGSGTAASIVIDPASSGMTINGRPVLSTGTNGNLGIGTSSPEVPLDVRLSGGGLPIRFGGDYYGYLSAGGVGDEVGLIGSSDNIIAAVNPDNSYVYGAGVLKVTSEGVVAVSTSYSTMLSLKNSSHGSGIDFISTDEGFGPGYGEVGVPAFGVSVGEPGNIYMKYGGVSEWGKLVHEDSSGNLAVGEVTPGAKLHVLGSAIIANDSQIDPSDMNTKTLLLGSRPDGYPAASLGFQMDSSNKAVIEYNQGLEPGVLGFCVYDNGFPDGDPSFYHLVIAKSGNVGIGTDSPTAKLDVNGNLNFTGTLFQNGTPFTSGGGWTASGSNAIFGSGNVGIGTTAPAARQQITGTTEQLRVGYDAANYYSTTVGSTGGVTFNAAGSNSAFTFADGVSVSDNLNVAGTVAMSGGEASGNASTAMSGGYANGEYATAMSGGNAYAPYSTAMSGGEAWGENSTVMSEGVSMALRTTAMSEGVACGPYSVAMSGGYVGDPQSPNGFSEFIQYATVGSRGSVQGGANSVAFSEAVSEWGLSNVALSGGLANGYYSTAMSGGSTRAACSTAMSGGTTANWGMESDSEAANYATAMSGGYAWGEYSVAMGPGATSMSAQSVVVGRNNVVAGTENGGEWVETDPLFVVGNGTGDESDAPEVKNRDALVVYKNGNVKIAKRQGDILMGEFGNPE